MGRAEIKISANDKLRTPLVFCIRHFDFKSSVLIAFPDFLTYNVGHDQGFRVNIPQARLCTGSGNFAPSMDLLLTAFSGNPSSDARRR